MIKKGILLTVVNLMISLAAICQQHLKADYDWDAKPGVVSLSEEEKKESAIILKNELYTEYYYKDENERELLVYEIVHRIIFINNSEAVESFNKIYIPRYNTVELIDAKARAISPSGQIKIADKSAVKEVSKDDNGNEYSLMAIEGVEKGGVVEYIYKVRKLYNFYGRNYLQSGTYTRHTHFELVSPQNLIFEVKGYNRNMDIIDSTYNERNHVNVVVDSLTRLKDEPFGNYNANLVRIDYRLNFNTANGRTPLYSWNQVAQNIVGSFSNLEKKEQKQIEKVIKDLKLDGLNQETIIKKVENYIKQNVAFIENQSTEQDLTIILKNKASDDNGMLKLFSAFFRTLNIPFEIILTCDRENTRFDPDFISYNQLRYTAFYFPESKKYLAPTKYEYRYGIIPANWTSNYGISIKIVALGDVVTGMAEAHFIEPLSYDKSFDNLNIRLSLTDDNEKVEANVERCMGGYYANQVYPYYPFMKDEDKKEFIESLFKSLIKDAEFKSTKVRNTDFTASTVDSAYCSEAHFSCTSLIETAGKKILFKIGESIGPQSELYNDTTRKTDIENDYNRLYQRTIQLTVPQGYKINNPDDLKFNVICKDKTDDVYGFVSSYKLEGNNLTVNISEYYKKINFPKERYEEYRKVINAAADFNKVVLILEKQ